MSTETKWHIATLGGSILIQSDPDVDIAQVFRPYPEATATFGIKEDSALGKWQTDQQLKNARLIAAAPELLKLVEEVVAYGFNFEWTSAAEKVIAKAKGEQ
jgi:hypothetical protein